MSDAISLRTPKYRHHKAKNLAVVTIRGRDIYLGKHGSPESQQEYRRLVAEYFQTGTVPRAHAEASVSVVEVIAAYLKFAKGYYRKTGKSHARVWADRRMLPIYKAAVWTSSGGRIWTARSESRAAENDWRAALA